MNRRLSALTLLLVVAGTGAPLMAQMGGRQILDGGNFPPGWSARPDDSNSNGPPIVKGVKFIAQGKDYHFTLGNQVATLVYRAADQVTTPFRFSAKVTQTEEPFAYPWGYGLFVGGQDLNSATPRYTYMLVRSNGQYLIRRRNGDTITEIKPWTLHPAVHQTDANGRSTNALAIEVKGTAAKPKLMFRVNGRVVDSLEVPAEELKGVVGLRGIWNLDLEIADYTVGRK